MGAAFLVVTLALAPLLPNYSLARHSVSEIGGLSSPFRWPFSAFLVAEALLVACFASGLAASTGSKVTAALTASLGLSYLGLAVFPTPHPLHNVFGLGSVLGYNAMLAAAVSWRRQPALRNLSLFSLAMFLWFLAGFVGTLLFTAYAIKTGEHRQMVLASQGLIQRTYIYTFHLWGLAVGLRLLKRRPDEAENGNLY